MSHKSAYFCRTILGGFTFLNLYTPFYIFVTLHSNYVTLMVWPYSPRRGHKNFILLPTAGMLQYMVYTLSLLCTGTPCVVERGPPVQEWLRLQKQPEVRGGMSRVHQHLPTRVHQHHQTRVHPHQGWRILLVFSSKLCSVLTQ